MIFQQFDSVTLSQELIFVKICQFPHCARSNNLRNPRPVNPVSLAQNSTPGAGSQNPNQPKELEKATTAVNPWNPSGPPIRINKKGKRSAPTPKACYRHAIQANVRQESPSASFAEINKTIAEKWKKLDDASKKPFEDESKHFAKLIKEDDEKQALRQQVDQPLSPCPNSNQTTTTNSSTPPPSHVGGFPSESMSNTGTSLGPMAAQRFPAIGQPMLPNAPPNTHANSGAVTPVSGPTGNPMVPAGHPGANAHGQMPPHLVAQTPGVIQPITQGGVNSTVTQITPPFPPPASSTSTRKT